MMKRLISLKGVEMKNKQVDKNLVFSPKTEKGTGRGEHPNSRANLKPFEKGSSGNPNGRPMKYEKLRKALIYQADEPYIEYSFDRPQPVTYRDAVIATIWSKAVNGSIAHINILAELGCLDAPH